MSEALLVLADGTTFEGEAVGAPRIGTGEVVGSLNGKSAS